MKLRLPLSLKMALLGAFALASFQVQASSETASPSESALMALLVDYPNPDILHQGLATSYVSFGFDASNPWFCTGRASVQFLNNTEQVFRSTGTSSFSFNNNGSISFKGNETSFAGAGIYINNESRNEINLTFQENETVLFEKNKARETGGAIFHGDRFSASGSGSILFDRNGSISFTGNEADIGGAIYTFRQTIFSNNGIVSITGNKSSRGVAAIYVANILSFKNNGELTITGNTNEGSVSGALYAASGVVISGNDKVTISGNTNASSGAGAIYASKFIDISGNNGDVLIENNTCGGMTGGTGAIYLDDLCETDKSLFSADGGNIIFDGNTAHNNERLALNVVYHHGHFTSMEFRAAENREIKFFDAFRYIANLRTCPGDAVDGGFILELNKKTGYTGSILLSGEKNGGNILTFSIEGSVNLHQGKLSITDNAYLELTPGYFPAKNGIFQVADGAELEMRKGGSLKASQFTLQTNAILTAGSGAFLTAGTINMGKGMTFNLSPFLDSKDSGLGVTADNWILGGDIVLSSLDFEGDTRWEKNQKFLLLDDQSSTRGQEDFYRILIAGTDSNIVQSGTAFNGQWTYEWENGKLYAVWTTQIREKGELWWDGEGNDSGNGIGTWNQTASNKVWNKDASDGDDWEFTDLDVVHFWKGGVVNIEGNVSVQGKVKPLGVIDVRFNEDKGTLVWQGSGSVTGTGTSLEKWGTGTLIIRTENYYKGGTALHGGTIQVETLTGLGSGLVTIHGGYLNLGTKGVENTIEVVGKGAISGISEGSVTVTGEGDLILLAGTSYTAGLNSQDILNKGVQINDMGAVSIQAGAIVNSGIRLGNETTSLNFIAGNGKSSQLNGTIEGNGTLNVTGGSHLLKNDNTPENYKFSGNTILSEGDLTVSAKMAFGNVGMINGSFVADGKIAFDTLTIGSGNDGPQENARIKVNESTWKHDVLMEIGSINVKQNATLHTEGILYARGETNIQTGGALSIGKGSTFISVGKVLTDSAADSLQDGRVTLGQSATWNANGGFELSYFNGREGTLTIGADSLLKANGFFASEKDVCGTDANGNLLPSFTPAEFLPVLKIEEGATLWTGTTTKHGNGEYQTLTGFYNVTLEIDELVTLGTFVTKGSGDGIMTHEDLVDSMKRAFLPEQNDQRNYVYILKDGVNYDNYDLTITSKEAVYVETGAIARVRATSGDIFNRGGTLQVDQINETGTVTSAGGVTDLLAVTSDAMPLQFIGSFGADSSATTAARIKIDEATRIPALIKVDTVQAQTGEKTVIGNATRVEALNFIISGADTILDNRGGALIVEKEIMLSDTASYNVGDKDRFGWVNMNQGNINLTQSSWKEVTLGSYALSSDETSAKIRLDETKNNTVEANELHIIGNDEQTLVNAGTTVGANKLIIGENSHLNVNGGTVNAHEALVYEKGVAQTGRINLTQAEGDNAPTTIQVSFAGNSHAGHIDSSAATGAFVHRGFNRMDGYTSGGRDNWTFVLSDQMLKGQSASNALAQIAEQSGASLDKITLDTSKLTESYFGDIQLYSDNITLTTASVDYGKATGTYNQKDAVKNFSYINPLVPEVSEITTNSLWTMTSAMDSLASAISGQLDLSPYRQTLARNIWAKGLYMNENIGKALPGYRKSSGGYVIGADTNLNASNLLGISFAQMLGTEMTNRHMAEIDQDILMASLYGRHLIDVDTQSSTALDFMIGYGRADNDGSFYKDETTSYSNWKSNLFNAKLKLSWYRQLNDRVSITPYAGGEFVFAEHDAHSIEGLAGAFDVSRSRMHALRLPIGTTVEYKTTSSITNYIGASYVPDVLRRNPSVTVVNGMLTRHDTDGSVGRHAGRFYTGATWQINRQWLINLNYELETACQKVNQRANLTTSYSF